MIDLLFRITLSNVGISLALAILAAAAGAALKRPALAHVLWLLVLVKLITPPVVTFPIIPVPWQSGAAAAGAVGPAPHPDGAAEHAGGSPANAYLPAGTWLAALDPGTTWFLAAWLIGSAIVLGWSLRQVWRFSRLLGKEAEAGAAGLQATAAEVAGGLGMKAAPAVYTTSARISPMVWWTGGRVWVVIPAVLLDQLDAGRFRWILAHELAHVRRRDYLVRWIEWLACVCFWWNPVVWWARNNLRANEELCCDALVVSALKPKPRTYGDSLLKAVEILAFPAHRLPVMASKINSGGLIERRITMIMANSNRTGLRWLQACVLAGALVVIPLGLTAQDVVKDREALIASIRAAVAAGEITPEQAKAELAEYDRKADLEALAAKIHAAVQAGKLTGEQGQARLDDYEKTLTQKARMSAEQAAEDERIRAAIAAGELTPEQGKARLAEFRREEESAVAAGQVRKALQAGEITEEQAEARLEKLKKNQEEKQARTEAESAAVAEELRAAVAAGKITREQAEAELVAYKMSLDAKAPGRDPIVEFKAGAFKLRTAVTDGILTREQADAKLAEAERVLIGRVVRDLSLSVERGKITKEEAGARMADFLKALEAVKANK